ncbi:type IV fimbrial biogenesis protein FimT [Aromatoleum tolulyticum]|uniref:Type II secretion system protein H n=1 Tax=Aromatoleum tolulyticum TaxID=34027 RepID=A0A1N6RIL2_9RHOO|nr:GspH/FimT family pseudopilin [Aromatoleum tolulyticum]SIQ28748.1 type IV fimbrial biogenesis protein FimT [Aromatoleum tolulyticum]
MNTTNVRDRLNAQACSAGFSLIELMIALAILAILTTIGYPSFQELLASQRVRAASSALYDSMVVARSEALKNNANASFALSGSDLAKGWTIQVGGQDVHSQSALAGLSFTPANPTIVYGTTGRLISGANTAITISTTGTNVQRCIRLDTTGRPRLTEGACS